MGSLKGLFLLLFIAIRLDSGAQRYVKITLEFTGIETANGACTLTFSDSKHRKHVFSGQRSNTAPFVFYSKAEDGSFRENEKIKGEWFLLTYMVIGEGKAAEKIIMKAEHAEKNKPNN